MYCDFLFFLKVRAFDPTIPGPPNGFTISKNINFIPIGISNETANINLIKDNDVNILFKVDTLENLIKR